MNEKDANTSIALELTDAISAIFYKSFNFPDPKQIKHLVLRYNVNRNLQWLTLVLTS